MPVAGHEDLRVLLGYRAVLPDPAVPPGHPRAEPDLAGGAVPGEHPVVRAGVGEVGDLGPVGRLGFAGRLAARGYHADSLAGPPGKYRGAAHLEALPRPAVAGAEQLRRGRFGVVRGDGTAEPDRLDGFEHR